MINKISICMACYNGEKFIHKQLDSILSQLSQDDEIIISDDGSTDNTLKVITQLNDKRIKIFPNVLKSGPVGNFENAINNATGDIVFLADQDDIWMDNKVNSHLKYHGSFDLVVSNAVVVDENHNILFKSFFKERGSKKGLIVNLLRNSYIGCCMSFKRNIIDHALPFPENIHMHDWWIGLVAEIKGSIYFLDAPLMFYIRHNNNASGTLVKRLPFVEQFKNRVGLLKNVLKLVWKNGSNQ